MEDNLRKLLKPLTLEMRHILEGYHDKAGAWVPGDLETRLRGLGVRRDRAPVPLDELPHLTAADRTARGVVDAYLELRQDAGIGQRAAVAEFIRETASTWATRLLALRCLEARRLVDDEVIVVRDAYAGRSMLHNRLLRRDPGLERAEDGGLFAALDQAFRDMAQKLPRAFDPKAAGLALRPSVAALKTCVALLSGTQPVVGEESTSDAVFQAPDALGWAYQYWNTEEKQWVFDAAAGKGPDRKRKKIEGADIIAATQLYTEPYMVKFLVQNALGATWAAMHPDTPLLGRWEYFVREADRAPLIPKPVQEITFLDPACGSGHFLIEAFDLFYDLYLEQDPDRDAVWIATHILTHNLHGIDIDDRAVQIAEIALWMKGAERAVAAGLDMPEVTMNLVATNLRLPQDEAHIDAFLVKHPEDAPLRPAIEVVFKGLQHADELGSLLLVQEPVDAELRLIKAREEQVLTAAERAAQLQMFRPAGERSTLPLTARNFDDWRRDVLTRLRDHFAEEARDADLVRAFFGRTVERALELFDLLSMRYDVVAANPPYMGSKNMGPTVRDHVGKKDYAAGKRDLYGAFILRCRTLLVENGRCAVIAPQAWMFMTSYATMRYFRIEDEDERGEPRVREGGLLLEVRFDAIVQLGRHAFSEADPPGNCAMFVFRNEDVDEHHRISCFRLAASQPAEVQADLVRRAAAGNLPSVSFRPSQRAFVDVPQAPLSYWLSPTMLGLFAGPTVGDHGAVRQGMATAADGRFLRFQWELESNDSRWVPFYKGGGYRKWDGLSYYLVDWQCDGARLEAFPSSVLRNKEAYFESGWTYTRMARGRMSTRLQIPSGAFSDKGPGIYLDDARFNTVLNSRAFSYLLRAISPNIAFEVDVVSRGPLPDLPPEMDVQTIVDAKHSLTATNPTERSFTAPLPLPAQITAAAHLHTLEGEAERLVCEAYGLSQPDISAITDETGTPVGWAPQTPPTPTQMAQLRSLFESGPGTSADEDDAPSDDTEEDDAITSGTPIHPETFLEELCQKVGLHPQVAARLILDGMAQQGWRCRPEEARIAADQLTVLVLRLLGHRWPTEIEAGDPLPPWADADGIIPLTSLPGESPLLDRVRERFGDGDEATLADALGKPLASWLHLDFFDAHVKQFKKRPPAWQIQSGAWTTSRAPAFAALLYCQRVHGDTLSRLRTQYVGPLQRRLENEERVLRERASRAPDQDQRPADQDQRRAEIRELLRQLTDLDAALREVSEIGFATDALAAIAVQDALQSLTQPLLDHMRASVKAAHLGTWTLVATRIDPSLGAPLRDALALLPTACARALAALPQRPEEPLPVEEDRIRLYVLQHATALGRAAMAEVAERWLDAYKDWSKAVRAAAKAAGRKVPTHKVEKQDAERLVRRILEWRPTLDEVPRLLGELPLFDAWCGEPGRATPATLAAFIAAEASYRPDINDGVRVNIAPLQKKGLLASPVLAPKDVEPAIADRASWRADERRWVREGKLPRPGWWPEETP